MDNNYQYNNESNNNSGGNNNFEPNNNFNGDNNYGGNNYAGNGGNNYGGNNYNNGSQYSYSANNQYVQPAHGKAVASLVLGIVGLCCCGICSVIGFVLSVQARNEGNNEGIRKAGYVLGIVGLALWAVGILFSLAGNVFG